MTPEGLRALRQTMSDAIRMHEKIEFLREENRKLKENIKELEDKIKELSEQKYTLSSN